MRIRSRLFLLVIAILIPASLGAGLGIYYVYDKQREFYEQSIQELTRAMALLLDKEMDARVRTLRPLASSPTITDNNLPGFYRFASEVAVNWDTTIVLSDTSGQQILNTRSPYGTGNLPKITPSLTELRREFGPQAALISDVYFAPIGKQHSFAVQIPVIRKGRLLYYLSMGTFTSQLQALLDEQSLPPGWIATVLDRQGVVAARSQNSDKFVGHTADATLRKKIGLLGEGTNHGVTLDGVPVMAFFSRAPKSEWSVVLSVPQSALQKPPIQASYFVAGIALLLLGLGIAAAAMVARRTAKAMEDLRQTAIDMGEGRRVARQSSGVLEIDAVGMEMARAHEQIRTAKVELEERVAEAVSTAKQSQKALMQSQKLEALGRLTGGIAHDFNNIMQTLTTGLQLALLGSPDSRARQRLETCQRAVQRATQLTRQLMAFGRVQDATRETMALPKKLEEIRPLLAGALGSNIKLEFDIAEDVWPITVDPLQLELALLNVTINARDAMPKGGVITVALMNTTSAPANSELAAGDYVRLSVADNGDGMAADVLAKALDPFFTTKSVGQGSGMGLSQAYGFAKQADGTLTIESKPGEGTTVTFYIPRAHTASTESPIGASACPPAKLTGSGRLLFVEDDQLVAAVVAPALQAAGFNVLQADTADKAAELLAAQGPFDLVFSDVVMPGALSGFDLAELVVTRYPQIRIVLATGYSGHQRSLPGVEVLAKPYKVEDAVALLCSRR